MGNEGSSRRVTTRPLPLKGVRVCDFTWIVAGPQATRILADLGAEVIKVENESYLDAVRGAPGLHNGFNRNKLGITANLHHPGGREVVERLIAKSDIVIENFSSGAFERMGFPYERLREIKADIIYISLSGFGQAGRDRNHGTWGPTAQGISGLTAMSALPGHPPAGWGYSYLDHTAGFYGAIAALMALWHRHESGEGQHVDMSQVETGMVLAGIEMLDYQVNGRQYTPIGNRSRWPRSAPHGVYPGREPDTWIAISVRDDAAFRRLAAAIGLDDPDGCFATNELRVEAEDMLDRAMAERCARHDVHELAEVLVSAGVDAGVCQTIEDRMERDPQLAARGFYPRAGHETLGEHRLEGLPVQFSYGDWRMDFGAPTVGQHNHEVLEGLLGFSPSEVDDLAAEAAI